MSITKQALRFILEDDKASPIEGDFLRVGNASILIDSETLKSLLQEYSKDFKGIWFADEEKMDSQTRASQKLPHICIKKEVLLSSLFPRITSFSNTFKDHKNQKILKKSPSFFTDHFKCICTY